ncbi:protein G [Uncultured phage WW-nAnB strain 2]|nr:protein G [Uncultured phage WW-nAnB strain 2]AHH02850.1 protein G [Uncultured phage WW-nAnB strain 2]
MEILPLQYCLGIFSVPEIGYFIVFAAVFSMLVLLLRP